MGRESTALAKEKLESSDDPCKRQSTNKLTKQKPTALTY